MFYTGIGSRQTPYDIQCAMYVLGKFLAKKGMILRSGGDNGADAAFEMGCDLADGKKEIYLPWKGFNSHTSPLFKVQQEALALAQEFHPAWQLCSPGAKKLHARNCYQILGADLNTPSSFVICWTPDGKDIGGTRTAIVLARHCNIPVFHLTDHNLQQIMDWVNHEHSKNQLVDQET